MGVDCVLCPCGHKWLGVGCPARHFSTMAEILRSRGFEPLELGLRQFCPCKGAHQRALPLIQLTTALRLYNNTLHPPRYLRRSSDRFAQVALAAPRHLCRALSPNPDHDAFDVFEHVRSFMMRIRGKRTTKVPQCS